MNAINSPIRRTRARRKASAYGTISVAVFAIAISLLIGLYIAYFFAQPQGIGSWIEAFWNAGYIGWMTRLVPAFLVGVYLGFVGYMQKHRDQRTGRLGILLNVGMLVPLNLLPLLWRLCKS